MISIRNVGKRFYLYDRPFDRAMDWVGMPARKREFWALRNISFDVEPGSALGIIGANGAGKSTLLKLLAGTLHPTEGDLAVEGRVAALLELGTGFHPEFTGRQNIWINGQLLGLTTQEIGELEADIIEFSELGDFIDQPLRTYSSGMIVRLGFSVAAAVEPDVLIIDEALSVGDARFSQKCMKRIDQFRETGTTLLFVSHDPHAVTTLCDECVLLVKGTVKERGTPAEVLEEYGAILAAQGTENKSMKIRREISHTSSSKKLHPQAKKSGTFQAIITDVILLNDAERETELFFIGSRMKIKVSVTSLVDLEQPTFGIEIRDHLGTTVFGTNSILSDIQMKPWKANQVVEFTVEIPVQLGEGDYTMVCAIHRDETHLEECFDWTDQAKTFTVRPEGKRKAIGRIVLPSSWNVSYSETKHNQQELLEFVFGDLQDKQDMKPQIPDPFLRGVSNCQNYGDVYYRWFEKEAVFFLRPKNRKIFFEGFLPEELPKNKLKFFVENELVKEIEVIGKEFDFHINLAETHTNRFIKFEIHASDSVIENNPKRAKGRQLAFALRKIHSEK